MDKKSKDLLQKKVLKNLKKGESGRLILAPRSGKTKVVIDLIKRDKIKGKILWVTPTSKLAKEDVPKEFLTWKASKYLPQLQAVTWKGLHKITGTYDLIVLDEEQFITPKNSLNLVEGKLIGETLLTMTGTESRSQVKKEIYEKLNLKVLYKISINEAVNIGLLSNYEIKVVMLEMDENKNIQVEYVEKFSKIAKSFMTSELKRYEYLNRQLEKSMSKFGIMQRRNLIGNSPSKLTAAKYIINSLEGRKLMFCINTKQAEDLCDYFYHGKSGDEDLKKFSSGEINKIAMVNKGGTGYTYKKIDNLILTQVDSDSNGLTSQKIARTLLSQKDYKACIWILCLKDTQDEIWLESTLRSFDQRKINFIEFKDLVL